MIKSMTAFGRACGSASNKNYVCEIKSVNGRYFDCQIKLPRTYQFLEEKIKSYVKENGISRGKIDIYVSIDSEKNENTAIALDEDYAASYIAALKSLSEKFDLQNDMTVMSVAQNRDIFICKKVDEDEEKAWYDLLPFIAEALDKFNSARKREGENLAVDLAEKKKKIEGIVEKIREISETNIRSYSDKLEQRLRKTLADLDIEIDGARILTECAIFADKIAIDEETVRLASHFKAFDEILASSEPVGRKLDFLLQEMNREINTIGSKSCDAKIASHVVDVKCELEKIREQIQNIE